MYPFLRGGRSGPDTDGGYRNVEATGNKAKDCLVRSSFERRSGNATADGPAPLVVAGGKEIFSCTGGDFNSNDAPKSVIRNSICNICHRCTA